MRKLKVWIFLYILIGTMNLSISYADNNLDINENTIEIKTEMNK